ncbi:MAG: hypothetical protein JNL03_13070 [Prolixibacteraceae bacterium]|nr:hypothetical protein [Prolixibacteraceae bacterium]
MKTKYIILIILFLVVLGAGIGLKMFFKPHADVSRAQTDFRVEAAALLSAFLDDEAAAAAKYSEKVLEIKGKLAAYSTLQDGTHLLILENEMEGISCQLDSSWAAANQPVLQELTIGRELTVKGVCKGYLMEIKVSPAVIMK